MFAAIIAGEQLEPREAQASFSLSLSTCATLDATEGLL